MLQPNLSIVIPVPDDASNLALCLTALQRSEVQPLEVIVVDDASVEDVSSAASQTRVRYLRLPRRAGPGAARNAGWKAARGEIVLFVDSDVLVPPDNIRRLLERFRLRSDLAGIFGSYDDSPSVQSFYSQFRNLLHHYVHQNSMEEAWTFWAGFGAMRRSALENSGGFDETISGIEDIELGMRMAAGGARFFLDKSLQVKHLKKWTLSTTVSTDIFKRAVPWTRLLLAAKCVPPDLNLTYSSRASAVLVAALLVTIGLLAASAFRWHGWRVSPMLFTAAVFVGCLLGLNGRFYAFLARKRGPVFACTAVAAHWFFYLYSSATFAVMWISDRTARLRRALSMLKA
jgi:hypothetical protein